MVGPVGPWNRARVARDKWSILQAIGLWPVSPRTTGQHHGATESSVIHPGELVETAGLRTQARVARESSSTPWTLGPGPEMHRRAGRPHGPSDLNARCPAHLVAPKGPGNRARVTGQMVDPMGTRAQARVPKESWSTPRDIGHEPEEPGTANRLQALGPGPESPGTAG